MHAKATVLWRRLRQQPQLLLLAGILALSFFLNFWNIAQNGTGNAYYAACIKSMTQSWHNFFYVSFDPAGMVSVDKPPLGLWVQALFCMAFGYSGWAMLLPQALAGTGSALLVYLLTAKHFNRQAGLLAALAFALFPAVVVVARNNTMDMQLILLLLLAVWCLMKAIDTGKWRWLLLCALFIGLGFNVKMLQAYLILPAVVLAYLLFAKQKLWKRFAAGGLAAAVMLAVSFAWVLAVDLTPANARPYVDSTSGNSAMELVFGHNGVERLVGQGMGGGQAVPERQDGQFAPRDDGAQSETGSQTGSAASGSAQPSLGDARDGGFPGDGNGAPGQTGARGGGAFGGEIGTAGPLRLWTGSLYGQGGWLLLFAIASCLLGLRWKALRQKDSSQRSLVFWGAWLATAWIFFSFAGFYHGYYLCMLAPPVAVLSGVGLSALFRGLRRQPLALPAEAGIAPSAAPHSKRNPRTWLLLAALLANTAVSVVYVWSYESVRAWLLPLLLALAVAGLALLSLHLIQKKPLPLRLAAALLSCSLLAASAYWAWTPVQSAANATIPSAGPTVSGQAGRAGAFPGGAQPGAASEGNDGAAPSLSGGDSPADSDSPHMPSGGAQGGGGPSGGASAALQSYLLAHYKAGSFLLTASGANDVAQLIVDTGLPCYGYGGFLGTDNSLTVARLQQLVSQGKIRYFLLSGRGGDDDDISAYVRAHATLIDASEYGSSAQGSLYLFA